MMEIRRATDAFLPEVHAVIDDRAEAYRGVTLKDQWHEPYMPLENLNKRTTTTGQ